MSLASDVVILGGAGSTEVRTGSGDPTGGGGVVAPVGAIYLRTTGQLYVKTGAGNTAWAEVFIGTLAVAHPARSLNSTFTPSTTRPVLGIYSVRIDSTIVLAGGQAGRAELVSDTSSPPTIVQASVAGGSTGTVVIGVSLTDTIEGVLVYLIPTGHNVRINTTNETGTPTFTLTRVTEITL